jgi:hypothetical protein
MSLLNRLLGKTNATGGWVQRLPGPLVVNFDQMSLCDVALGSRFEGLYFLGPDDDPHATASGYHEYRALGVAVGQSDDGFYFEHLTVNFYTDDGVVPFAGRFVLDGNDVPIDRDTTFEQLKTYFKGWELETHEEEGGWIEEADFTRGDASVEFSWEEDGTLIDIEIYRASD